MQRAPDTMTHKFAYSREVVRLSIRLNCSANVAQAILRTSLLNAKLHAAPGDIQQFLRSAINISNRVGRTGITNPAFIQYTDIDANNIAILQFLLLTRDTMTDD